MSINNIHIIIIPLRAFHSASVRAFHSASVRAFHSASVRAFHSASVRAFHYREYNVVDPATFTSSSIVDIPIIGGFCVFNIVYVHRICSFVSGYL